MSIKKKSWILLGIFLWGLPTAIFLSLLLAVKKPGTWETQSFQSSIFFKSLTFITPVFIVLGIVYGLFMHQLAHKGK